MPEQEFNYLLTPLILQDNNKARNDEINERLVNDIDYLVNNNILPFNVKSVIIDANSEIMPVRADVPYPSLCITHEQTDTEGKRVGGKSTSKFTVDNLNLLFDKIIEKARILDNSIKFKNPKDKLKKMLLKRLTSSEVLDFANAINDDQGCIVVNVSLENFNGFTKLNTVATFNLSDRKTWTLYNKIRDVLNDHELTHDKINLIITAFYSPVNAELLPVTQVSYGSSSNIIKEFKENDVFTRVFGLDFDKQIKDISGDYINSLNKNPELKHAHLHPSAKSVHNSMKKLENLSEPYKLKKHGFKRFLPIIEAAVFVVILNFIVTNFFIVYSLMNIIAFNAVLLSFVAYWLIQKI